MSTTHIADDRTVCRGDLAHAQTHNVRKGWTLAGMAAPGPPGMAYFELLISKCMRLNEGSIPFTRSQPP
jgi:hypothetical protein